MKKILKRIVKISLLILLSWLLVNIGVWIEFTKIINGKEKILINLLLEIPQLTTDFSLVFDYWLQKFPQIPIYIIVLTILGIVIFVITILIFLPKTKGKYGYAEFAKIADIRDMGLNFYKGIIFGKVGYFPFTKFVKMNKPLSTLILAPPGTGKTAGVVIPTLLTTKNSVIVHDPKGELYDLTHKARQKFSKVMIFEPASKKSNIFNPFCKSALPSKSQIRSYIKNIATIIFPAPKHNDKEFFVNTARSTFSFFAQWLIWKNGETSFAEIRKKLLDNRDIIGTIREMTDSPNLPEDIRIDGNGISLSEDAEEQLSGIMMSFKEGVEIFADEIVAKATNGKNQFNIDDLRKNIVSIYVKVKDIDSDRLQPLTNLFFQFLGKQLISKEKNRGENNITYILDEFPRLGRIDIIKNLPSISRSYGVNVMFIAQDYAQIIETYNREAVEIFKTNCAYKIVFRQNNLETAEAISKTIGNKTQKKKSTSKNMSISINGKNGGNNVSESEEPKKLLTTQDIMSLKKDKCLIVPEGSPHKPIKANIAFWFKDKKLRKLVQND